MFRDEGLENLVARKDYDQIRNYVNEKKDQLFEALDDNDREKLETALDRLRIDMDNVTDGTSTRANAFIEIGRLLGVGDTIRHLLSNADQNEASLSVFGEEKDLPADTMAIADQLYRQGCMTHTELARVIGVSVEDLLPELESLKSIGMVYMTDAGKFRLCSLTNLGNRYVSEVDKAAQKHFGRVSA